VTAPDVVSDNPFRLPAFRLFWGSRMAAVLGSQIQAMAIGYQVYDLARAHGNDLKTSAFYLGMVGLAQFVPMFLLVLPAGVVADQRDRKAIFAICLFADALIAVLYVALSLHGAPPLWTLCALAALFGASRAFVAPASSAALPMLVPRAILSRAIVLNSLAFQSGAIVGPAIGGLIYAVSPTVAYSVALVLFLIGAGVSLLIPGNTKPEPSTASRWELMKEGLAYVWRTKIVFGAISLDLVAVLLGGATLLMPAFARDVLHVGPQGAGLMRAAGGVGAGLMAIYLAIKPIRRHGGLWMFVGVAVFGVATIVFGLSKIFWLTLLALALLGAADMISVNVRQTLIQIVTPDAMRGRVSAVSMLFISASNELGEFETGIVARFLGPVGAAVFGGVGSLMATGLWAAWFPQLRKADRLT
jgi:MFS family permease